MGLASHSSLTHDLECHPIGGRRSRLGVDPGLVGLASHSSLTHDLECHPIGGRRSRLGVDPGLVWAQSASNANAAWTAWFEGFWRNQVAVSMPLDVGPIGIERKRRLDRLVRGVLAEPSGGEYALGCGASPCTARRARQTRCAPRQVCLLACRRTAHDQCIAVHGPTCPTDSVCTPSGVLASLSPNCTRSVHGAIAGQLATLAGRRTRSCWWAATSPQPISGLGSNCWSAGYLGWPKNPQLLVGCDLTPAHLRTGERMPQVRGSTSSRSHPRAATRGWCAGSRPIPRPGCLKFAEAPRPEAIREQQLVDGAQEVARFRALDAVPALDCAPPERPACAPTYWDVIFRVVGLGLVLSPL